YGGRGYPTFVLIGGDGSVLSYGMPSNSQIEAALETVQLVPELPEDRKFDPLRRLLKKRGLKAIGAWLEATLAAGAPTAEIRAVAAEQKADFDRRVASASQRVARLAEGPDYLRAEHKLEEIARDFEGLPPGREAEAVLDRFDDDDHIRSEIKALKYLERVLRQYDPTRIAQRRKLADALREFQRRYADTYAEIGRAHV